MGAKETTAVEPSRLAGARIARGLSRSQVAADIGFSASFYSNLELGNRGCKPYIPALSNSLHFPEQFFYGDPLKMPDANSFSYRRKSSVKIGEQRQIEAIGAILATLPMLIRDHISLPPVSVPDLSALAGGRMTLTEFGETVSTLIRQRFSMGDAPLRHAIDLVEALGIFVFWVDGPEGFDGVSYWVGDQPFILLNRNQLDGYRIRFTVLHELLHLLCHRGERTYRLDDDRQADAFASAMLLPTALYSRNCRRRFDPYLFLEDRATWGASVGCMVRRLYDLRIISEDAYRYAFIRMQKMGWRTKEPRPMPVEQSSIHKFFMDEATDKGVFSFDLAEQAMLPYDLFLNAIPVAYAYERAASAIRGLTFSPGPNAA